MTGYACIVQEDQTPAMRQEALARGLREIGREFFGDTAPEPEIRWIVVPTGFGFTAGAPSTSSLVARSVPEGYPDAERERFMRRVCDLWTDVTGCTHDEIVVTALDGPLPV